MSKAKKFRAPGPIAGLALLMIAVGNDEVQAQRYSAAHCDACDWTASDWSAPVNVAASKLLLVGGLPVSLQAGAGYWATAPDSGPEGFRLRLQFTLLFPR